MNFNQFVREWKESMVYNPDSFDFEETLNELYIEYKYTVKKYAGMGVKEWCEDWFAECDLDTHPYMLKAKALKTRHGNGLRELANKYRSSVGLPLLPLID